jgi:hypothetical protein
VPTIASSRTSTGTDMGVKPVLVRHEVHREPEDGLMEAHAVPRQDIRPGSGHLHAAGEVHQPVHLTQLEVRAGLETLVLLECPGEVPALGCPPTQLDIAVRAGPHRNIRVGRQRHAEQDLVEFRLDRDDLLLQRLDLVLEFGRGCLDRLDLRLQRSLLRAGRGLQFAHELTKLRAGVLGQPLLLGAQVLLAAHQVTTGRVQGHEPVDIDAHALLAGAVDEAGGVFTQGLQVDHGATV